MDATRAEMGKAGEQNRQCELWAKACEKVDIAKGVEAQARAKTARLYELTGEKATRIAAVEMPVEGLGIDTERGVLFQNVPFDQASTGDQLEVSAAIGMALNPKLRVLRFKDGSLLDSKHMERLEKLAKDRDYQFWIERVAEEDSGVGFYIENGQLAQRDEPAGDLFDENGQGDAHREAGADADETDASA